MSRMDSIRNIAKGAALTGAVAGVTGAAIGLNSNKDLSTSMNMGGYAAAGALAGGAVGGMSRALRALPKLGMMGARGGFNHMSRAIQRSSNILKPSMKNTAMGALSGTGLGLGYATLQSNKPVSFSDRLKFEQSKKQMSVDENLRQFKEMREIMAETRLR